VSDFRIKNGSIELACTRSGLETGPPVLFLHGITSCRDSWLESTERLGDRFDCWALDFRGHGDSDRAPGEYLLEHYASDAASTLDRIGRPAVVVGHSVGGVTATQLSFDRHPFASALFLEDPPLFVSDAAVFSRTLYPKLFSLLQGAVSQLRADDAPFDAYLELAANAPSPMGGVAADHLSERQVRSRALQLQHFDPSCLDVAIDGRVFAGFDPTRPITCPVTLLAGNEAYGAAFLDGDDERLLASSPQVRIVAFPEVGHAVRASTVSAARFLDELDAFVTTNS
jgi:pimeloyl-ACP methyl ester carboxylesterase